MVRGIDAGDGIKIKISYIFRVLTNKEPLE